MPGLTQEQADLLYAAILHLHDDRYSQLGHDHDELYAVLSHSHGRQYSAVDATETTISTSWGTKVQMTLPAGTWHVNAGWDLKALAVDQYFVERIYNVTAGAVLLGGGWRKNGHTDFVPASYGLIFTLGSSSVIALQTGNPSYASVVKNAFMIANELET